MVALIVHFTQAGPLDDLIGDVFFYATQYERRHKKSLTPLLLATNKAIKAHIEMVRHSQPYTNVTFEAMPYRRLGAESFMDLAFSHNLKTFVIDLTVLKHALTSPLRREAYILRILTQLGDDKRPMSVDFEMICILLKNGPQIHLDIRLDSILLSRGSRDFETKFSIVRSLCECGAIKWKSYKMQQDALHELIGKEDAAELLSIMKSRNKADTSKADERGFKFKFLQTFGAWVTSDGRGK
jgi:hypothetical protein